MKIVKKITDKPEQKIFIIITKEYDGMERSTVCIPYVTKNQDKAQKVLQILKQEALELLNSNFEPYINIENKFYIEILTKTDKFYSYEILIKEEVLHG